MNSLHKKRQAFRQAIRSKSIQELFYRKRQQLLQQLKKSVNKQQTDIQTNKFKEELPSTLFTLLQNNFQTQNYHSFKRFFKEYKQEISQKQQQHVFVTITNNNNLLSLQKLDLISRLVNKKQFCLNTQIQTHYGWKKIIQEFLSTILQSFDTKGDSKNNFSKHSCLIKENQIKSEDKIDLLGLKNMICFSLIKIWQLKPKTEYFLMFTKAYHIIHQKVSNTLSLTLISQLSYDKILLPNHYFINKLLQVNVDKLTEVKLFRTLQIFKNFIFHLKVQNSQIHARQLVFQYLSWIKIQINLILSCSEINQTQNMFTSILLQSESGIINNETQFETRYCLIYLLFSTLNKLFEINEKQKQLLNTKEILILNEELLNHTQNHTTLKFLIQEGKSALDIHHKKNIFRTLTFFISFLQISTWGKNKQQNSLGAQLQQIQKTFQGTQLDWFQTFN